MSDKKILDLQSALADMAGDKEIYEEVLAVFLQDTPNTLKDIKKAFNESDITTLNRLSHSVKSASRSIGGMNLGTVAEKLEHESAMNNPQDIENLINELNTEFLYLKQKLAEKGFGLQLT